MAKTMYVESSVTINRDVHDVFEYVKYAKNRQKYSAWRLNDPSQKISETGEDGKVGHIVTWESQSDNIGAGSQQLTNLVEDQELQYAIDLQRPVTTKANEIVKVDKERENMAIVTWSMEAPIGDASEDQIKDMENNLTAFIDESLVNLKNCLEG